VNLSRGAAQNFLMQLRQLPSQSNRPLTKFGFHILKGIEDTVRAFIGNQRCYFIGQFSKRFPSGDLFWRKEANKTKFICRQARSR